MTESPWAPRDRRPDTEPAPRPESPWQQREPAEPSWRLLAPPAGPLPPLPPEPPVPAESPSRPEVTVAPEPFLTPPSASARRAPVVLVALVVLAVVAGLGVVAALRLGGDDDTARPPARTPPSPNQPATPQPEPTAVDPVAEPPALIDWSAVSTDPAARAAALTLGTYYDAINRRDWSAAYAVYSSRRQADQPFDGWRSGVETSSHSDVRLDAVSGNVDGTVTASATFRSHQATGAGPPDRPAETCTNWSITYRLVREGPPAFPLRIDAAPDAADTPC